VNLAGRHALVLGLGETGLSLVRYLTANGATVHVTDTNPAPSGLKMLEESGLPATFRAGFEATDFAKADLIAASPGVATFAPHAATAVANARERGVPIVGDFELFGLAIQALPADERPTLIGITGTNGKSTVTAMVGAMCKAAELETVIAGNIGIPILDAWMQAQQSPALPDVFALEVSSYQLETTESLALDSAAVLNLTQDHLDRYGDMSAYSAAKARLFMNASLQVVNRDDPATVAMARSTATRVSFGPSLAQSDREWGVRTAGHPNDWLLMRGTRPLMAASELRVTGLHNVCNALAAFALTSCLPLSERELVAGLREFEGLPHRNVPVATIAGITFFDDSKGTNVGATAAALHERGAPVILIAGGVGKSQDFRLLRDAVLANARAVILIGESAPDIAAALKDLGRPLLRAESMAQAVLAAFEQAERGDHVLLSPACSSFDMFRNYHHRGEVFAEAVRELARAQKMERV
jgi:UDP-N-acetylmuramoylalanine--D-glutamate ligase